ncbi:MAG: suppressor of fused domain protein [Armatimonadota bacterium]
MFDFLRRLFGKKKVEPDFSDEQYERHYEQKQAALEKILGKMHDLVGHAIIPFQIGGGLDRYYFPHGIPGTGFATMELLQPDGSGPKPNRIGTYELVAFTRLPMTDGDEQTPFKKMESRIYHTLYCMAMYAPQAVLNPGETCEIPGDDDTPSTYLVFDHYDPNQVGFIIDGKQHCLLLCLEVFKDEMEFARKNGGAQLLQRLKDAGHYPYSDLDRAPVV